MTTIREVNEQLKTANHPVARVLHNGDAFKALVIGFKNGMNLKEHKAHLPSKLTVLSGKVIYRQAETNTVLEAYDEVIIPINIIHSVEAMEDSLCLLTQG